MKALYVLILAISLGGPAQPAILRWRVTDESGAVIPGANITITAGLTTKTHHRRFARHLHVPGIRGQRLFRVGFRASTIHGEARPHLAQTGDQTLNVQLRVTVTTQQVTVKENAAPVLSTDAAYNASGAIQRDLAG